MVRRFRSLAARLLSEEVLGYGAILLSFILAGGLFYVLVNRPPAATRYGTIDPRRDSQTVSELILVAMAYAVGTGGLYLIYDVRKHVHNPRYAQALLLAGVMLMVVSTMLLMVSYGVKVGR